MCIKEENNFLCFLKNKPFTKHKFNKASIKVFDNLKPIGVYFLYDENLNIIYIGKSKNLFTRLMAWNSNQNIRHNDFQNAKGKCIRRDVEYFSIYFSDLRFLDALEKIQIAIHQPIYNVSGNSNFQKEVLFPYA